MAYSNPVVINRADPWIYKHVDGYYYFIATHPDYQVIELRRAKKINELKQTKEIKIIWYAHDSGNESQLIWAPELHFIANKWYVYFAASDDPIIRDADHHHRMFVLENTDTDPFKGEWVDRGQIKTHQESFSLDGTVFQLKNDLYYCWAQSEPTIPGNSNLYLAKMSNPWTLKGKILTLSIPTLPWECQGFMVNEGPAAIIRNGKVILSYSASATDENYAMGLIWANVSDDLLDGYSWHKSDLPVFKSSEASHQFGPGHNSFTVSEDGTTDLLVYHARPEKNQSGDPLANPNRHTRVQAFKWGEDGLPIFGEPVKD